MSALRARISYCTFYTTFYLITHAKTPLANFVHTPGPPVKFRQSSSNFVAAAGPVSKPSKPSNPSNARQNLGGARAPTTPPCSRLRALDERNEELAVTREELVKKKL